MLPESGSLIRFLDAALGSIAKPLVIILDQFEEFFITLSPKLRAAFIDELAALNDARDIQVKVVLSLREEWLAWLSEIEERVPEVFSVKMRLLPLSRDQAYLAITTPAKRLGIQYELNLVDLLLNDLSESAGTEATVMPPQLQLVCDALYDALRPAQQLITKEAYEDLEGVEGVLRTYLQDVLRDHFSSEDRALARQVLEELVTSLGTKSVRTSAELASLWAQLYQKFSVC